MSDAERVTPTVPFAVAQSPPRDRWWITALIVGVIAGVVGAILLPEKWKLPAFAIAACAFLITLLFNPYLRYWRFARLSFYTAAGVAAIPTIRFGIQAVQGRGDFEMEGAHWSVIVSLVALTAFCVWLDFQWRKGPSQAPAFLLNLRPGVRSFLWNIGIGISIKQTSSGQAMVNSPNATQTQGTAIATHGAGVVQGDMKIEVHNHGVPNQEHARVMAENLVLKRDVNQSQLQIFELQKALDQARQEARAGNEKAEKALVSAGAGDLAPLQELRLEQVESLYKTAVKSKKRFLGLARQLIAVAYFANDYHTAALWARRVLELDASDVFAYFVLGDFARIRHSLSAAMAHYRAAESELRRRLKQNPESTKWQRDLSVSLSKIGDVLASKGDGPGALRSYQDSLEIRRQLATKNPETDIWQHDLSVSLDRIGDVLEAQDNSPGALRLYREGLKIACRLATKDPENTEWQRDLWVSLVKIGDVLATSGDGPGALHLYREGLEICRRLATKDSENTQWQGSISVTQSRIGHVLAIQGDGTGALHLYNDSLEITRRLAKKDTENTEWQRSLSVSLDNIGDVLATQGDGSGALRSYREGLEIACRLATKDPESTEWQRDLAVSYNKLAHVAEGQGNRNEALDWCQQALTIVEKLTKLDPTNAVWREDLQELRELHDRLKDE